jgi:protein SDA1
VEGADLLLEYESKKAAFLRKKAAEEKDGTQEDGDQDMEEEVEGDDDGWVEVEDSDEEAPDLMVLPEADKKPAAESDGDEDADAANEDEEEVIDLSKMTPQEREKLRMEVSATRIFSSSDFAKMRKLVEREKRARRDPREAARRKRAIAKGEGFEELSEDESGSEVDSDEEDNIRVTGVVNPNEIMALATKKRHSKAERLTKVLAGREKFESRSREGGSTNIEKKRKKNFLMSKFSRERRISGNGKRMCQEKKNGKGGNLTHENKKRRRKL